MSIIMGETLLQMVQTLKSYSFALKKLITTSYTNWGKKAAISNTHNKQSGKYQIREKK